EQDLRKFTTATTGTLRTRGRELPPGDGERGGRPDTRPRVKLGGVIHSLRLKNSKKGDRYATFVLEDKEGVVEVIAWPDTYPCDAFLHLERGDESETVLALPATLRVTAGGAIVSAVERLLGAGVMSFR